MFKYDIKRTQNSGSIGLALESEFVKVAGAFTLLEVHAHHGVITTLI